MLKKAENPNEKMIEFYEEEHKYICDGIEYISVTTLVSTFFPQFDSERISFFYAKKHGLNQQDVLNDWAKIGRDAEEFGTNVHKHIECLFKQITPPQPINEREEQAFRNNEFCYSNIIQGHTFIEGEKIIFSEKLKLAGTVDLILESKKDNAIIVLDWKTTKKLDYFDPYKAKGYGELKHLDNCNFNHYCLQLNLYKKILLEENYYPNKEIRMGLVHVNQQNLEPIKIPEMSKEVEAILKNK